MNLTYMRKLPLSSAVSLSYTKKTFLSHCFNFKPQNFGLVFYTLIKLTHAGYIQTTRASQIEFSDQLLPICIKTIHIYKRGSKRGH